MKHNRLTRLCSLCLILALAFSFAAPALAADGNGSSSSAATGFSISLPTSFKMAMGTPGTLTAEVTAQPEGATLPDLTWTWETQGIGSDTAPFTHTTTANSMVITPTTVGTAKVIVSASATIDGKKFVRTAETIVEIGYAPATAITLLPSGGVTLDVSKTQLLNAYLTPSADTDATNGTWSSSAPGVVKLSSSTGQQVVATAVKPGTATVTAYSGNTSVSASCSITVRGIAMALESVSMTVGQKLQLGATGYEVDSPAQQWSSANESVAIVHSTTGEVTALSVGTALITVTMGSYSATCFVEVSENSATAITASMKSNETLSLQTLRSKLNSVCQSTLSNSINYITNLTVRSDEGILYYGYGSSDNTGIGIGATERYYYSPRTALGERALSEITFVPCDDFVGTATIYYTAFSSSGTSFSGEIRVSVANISDVAESTPANVPIQLDVKDFADVCRTKTNGSLQYVTFQLPSASRGTLYYKYVDAARYAEPVSADTKYRVTGNPLISDITFVPAENYVGTVTFGYTAVDTAGKSHSGTVSITVTGDTASWDEIVYHVSEAGRVDFDAADFNAACLAAGGTTLSYVRFVPPDNSVGTLYHDYRYTGTYATEVSYNTRYYYKSEPSISDITFFAEEKLTDAVFLDFVAYDTSGNRFNCKVCIEPYQSSVQGFDLYYSARAGQAVTFDANDFNELSLELTGSRLNYVKFVLPSASYGTLYYNYHSTTVSKVSANTAYYRSGTLNKISFVPASSFSGTFPIEFVGYTVDGKTFDGLIWITSIKGKDLTITHTTAAGGAVIFNAAEFNNVCLDLTGESLNYVRFTIPASTSGTLCYNYSTSTGKYKSTITASTNCYRTETSSTTRRVLDLVAFLAKDTYTGTVEIPFTGWSVSGNKFNGTVKITVTEPTARTISYTGSSVPFTLNSSDFNQVCRELLGRDLSYIRFTSLPDQTMGRLYLDYTSPSLPGSSITVNKSYYADPDHASSLNLITFVPKADYQGVIHLQYTGKDTAGSSFTGTVAITISSLYASSSYTDMAGYEYAIPAVEFLSGYGIITGNGNGQFNPGGYLTRADFAVLICRAFRLNSSSTETFSDVPTNKYYSSAVATAKSLGIVQGNGTLFFPNGTLTREDAILMLQRAINTVGIDLPTASKYLLDHYADGNRVSGYAKQAVATLASAGIVTANEAGELMPKHPIRRADVAVMLYRILTY